MNQTRTSLSCFETTKKLLDRANRDLKLKCKSYDAIIQKLLAYGYRLRDLNISPETKILPKEDESIKCLNRIFHDEDYWCVNKPPKMVKLPTLDICKVCTARKMGLKDKTKVSNQAKPLPLSKNFSGYGMIPCRDGGLWVYPSKCKTCSIFECSENPRNRKKRLEKEGRQYG